MDTGKLSGRRGILPVTMRKLLLLAAVASLSISKGTAAPARFTLVAPDAATVESVLDEAADEKTAAALADSGFADKLARALAPLAGQPVGGADLERVAQSVALAQGDAMKLQVHDLAAAGVFRGALADRLAAESEASAAHPSTTWKEVVAPDEAEKFAGFAREINAQQQQVAHDTGVAPRRGFHMKIHAGVRASFRVLPDLPEAARAGVFREARTFPAVVRFSNGSPGPQADGRPDPRGIAIKLIGAPGKKLLPGLEDEVTQDFLATSHSVTSTVRNVYQFMAFIHAAKNKLTLPITLARELGIVESARLLKAFASTVLFSKVKSMATESFSSTAPLKLGAYAIKFTVRPAAGTPAASARPKTDDFLHDELADRLRAGDLKLDLLIQFYTDDAHTPIEDTSVAWTSPAIKVAEVTLLKTDLDSAEGKALTAAVDRLAYNPWHTTEEMRPLGNIMRARRVAYDASQGLRGHAAEPKTLEDVR